MPRRTVHYLQKPKARPLLKPRKDVKVRARCSRLHPKRRYLCQKWAASMDWTQVTWMIAASWVLTKVNTWFILEIKFPFSRTWKVLEKLFFDHWAMEKFWIFSRHPTLKERFLLSCQFDKICRFFAPINSYFLRKNASWQFGQQNYLWGHIYIDQHGHNCILYVLEI